jgi:hypothetical protein
MHPRRRRAPSDQPEWRRPRGCMVPKVTGGFFISSPPPFTVEIERSQIMQALRPRASFVAQRPRRSSGMVARTRATGQQVGHARSGRSALCRTPLGAVLREGRVSRARRRGRAGGRAPGLPPEPGRPRTHSRAQTAGAGGKTGVLFVCLGNICRSPAAEAVFKAVLAREGVADQFDVDSCGTGGGNPDWWVRSPGRSSACACTWACVWGWARNSACGRERLAGGAYVGASH